MPTYTPLQSIQLASSSASVTFSNIPQTYQDLIIVVNCASESTNAFTYLQFNGDTATNYSFTQLYGTGSSALSSRQSNYALLFNSDVSMQQTTISFNVIYQIMNYSNSTTFKTSLARQSSTSAADYNGALAAVGLWRNTNAINSIKIQATRGGVNYNFTAGSTFDLYGISPVAAQNAQAFGGTEIYYDSSYVYHVFKGSGAFTPYRNLSADVLVIAGGGGGSRGGGGAGGVSYQTGKSLSANTSYTVTVGAGGVPGGTGGAGNAGNGSNSVFSDITSNGGGRGGDSDASPATGFSGGSGGGGGGTTSSISGGATSQGNSGGATGYGNAGGSGNNYYQGGGGGGSGAAGGNAVNNNSGSSSNTKYGGDGGAGLSTWSSWGSVTGTGQNVGGTYYYAGGGGGYGRNGNGGDGGSGGGGTGWGDYNSRGQRSNASGLMNTGSGGGGGTSTSDTTYSFQGLQGFGGSGIVIVRYAR
jgi:hypothetical protein